MSTADQFKNKTHDLHQNATEFGRAAAAEDQVSAGHLVNKAADLKHKVAELGSAAKQAAMEQASTVRDVAEHLYDQGRERAGDLYDKGREHAQQIERTMEAKVRQQPLPAVLIAAGIGFILGAICTRR